MSKNVARAFAIAALLYSLAYAFDVALWAIRDAWRQYDLQVCHQAAHGPQVADAATMLQECDALYR